ncbi:MAG TPA: protein kinase [Kofleriaceae bacterium]|nr:protein kinase [Kofleriaceae bacterium]
MAPDHDGEGEGEADDDARETLLPSLHLSILGKGDDDALPDTGDIRPRAARQGDVVAARYRVEGVLGRGGMGRVLRVRHQVLGKAFALKLIRTGIATDPRARELFYREARLASACAHDHICSIVDFGEDPRFGLFMVMELLDGQSLHARLRTGGRVAPKVACDILWQVADAVRFIHGRAIVHGDIKSENIFLLGGGGPRRVKLLDFGLSRPDRGAAGGVDGTPEYLAPERVRGEPATVASDVYALGIVAYELFTGELPFSGAVADVFRHQLGTPVPAPSTRVPEPLDARADALVARATAKDPRERHRDVAGFLYELRTLMGMLGIDVSRRRTADTEHGRDRRELDARGKAAAEVFAHAPIPMASVDVGGKVRVANRAFLELLGVAGDAVGLELRDSALVEVYPTLLADLAAARSGRGPVKRVIYLAAGGDVTVEVAVLLTPAPSSGEVTAGDLHLALHPLRELKT